jgi:hypothetical protein
MVSLVPDSTTGWGLSSLRDEVTAMAGTSGSPALSARSRAAMKGARSCGFVSLMKNRDRQRMRV